MDPSESFKLKAGSLPSYINSVIPHSRGTLRDDLLWSVVCAVYFGAFLGLKPAGDLNDF